MAGHTALVPHNTIPHSNLLRYGLQKNYDVNNTPLSLAPQVSSNHSDRRAKTPPQLRPIDLLSNLHRPLVAKLIP